MRVAVCISGQPRNIQEAFPHIKANLIDPYDADVFVHTYAPEGQHYSASGRTYEFTDNVEEYIRNTICPIKYMIEPVRYFKDAGINIDNIYNSYGEGHRAKLLANYGTEEKVKEILVHNFYSMFYSIFQAHTLMKTWRLEHNVQYDCVVRVRFDFAPLERVQLDGCDMERIHYLDIHQPDGLISDWINFGGQSVMDVYASIWLLYETIINGQERTGYYVCNESLIRDIMKRFNIEKTAFNMHYKLMSH